MEPRHKREPTTFPRPERRGHFILDGKMLSESINVGELPIEDKKRIHYQLSKSKSTVFLPAKVEEEKKSEQKEKKSGCCLFSCFR